MPDIEVRAVTPEEMIRDIENLVKQHTENKYAFQVGLKDVDFEINYDLLASTDFSIPFQSISKAEQALQGKVVTPTIFIEIDGTEHQILAFDSRPVGFSGFMDCVTHSLALTNLGLFEVGRFSAVNLTTPGRYWQWFLHRRLGTTDEVVELMDQLQVAPNDFVDRVFHALTE